MCGASANDLVLLERNKERGILSNEEQEAVLGGGALAWGGDWGLGFDGGCCGGGGKD